MAFNKLKSILGRIRGIFLFGHLGYSIKELPNVKGKMYLHKSGIISIGKNCTIKSTPWATQLTIEKDGLLHIGNKVSINAGCDIAATKEIQIGNNVRIGTRTIILDSDYHPLDASSLSSELSGPIRIEDNVWVGTRCIITRGVTIGKNSVVASGSIVNKDVPPNVLVGGIPAKVLKEVNAPDGWVRV